MKKTTALLLMTLGLPTPLSAQFGWLKKLLDKVFGSNMRVEETEFYPTRRLSGIGVDRRNMSDAVFAERVRLMIDSQTFAILRDPQAQNGAARVTAPSLQKIFFEAAATHGFTATKLEAIAYVESWGNPKAISPTGPKGIMQFTRDTARSVGLIYTTTITKTVPRREIVKGKNGKPLYRRGKPVYRTVRKKISLQVEVDDRLKPEKAIPAAAQHLAQLSKKYGGEDLAIFAYHCGEGCLMQFIAAARQARIQEPITSAKIFFLNHPAWNRPLYLQVRRHMARDWSPTYYFRVLRAEQLLALYRTNRAEFDRLTEEFRNRVRPNAISPNRFWVWLTPKDLIFSTCEDLKVESGRRLAKVFDNPDYFGFTLRKSGPGSIGEAEETFTDAKGQSHKDHRELYLQASPVAIGALTYVAFEVRRLHRAITQELKLKGTFVPFDVTALVRPLEYQRRLGSMNPNAITEFPTHCTGQVFDIGYATVSEEQEESMRFILDDIGYHGYLAFIVESLIQKTFHAGPSPTSADFFTAVYQEALAKKR